MPDTLTQQQENFCMAYVETGNASEAYRRAYNAERMKPTTVNRKASELMESGKITATMFRSGSEFIDSLIDLNQTGC